MSLDEKEYEDTTGHMAFYADNVKQFIKELQTKLIENLPQNWKKITEILDELAGKGLI